LQKINVEQILNRAKFLHKKGKISEAYALYKEVLNTFPKNTRAKQAIEYLTSLKKNYSKQNPSSEVIKELLNLFNNGQFSTVIERTQALSNNYPNAFVLWNILGASAYQSHMLVEAINAYKKALSINPDYAEAYNNMGVALKDLGKIDEAIKIFKKAILIKPHYVEAYNNLGNAYKDQHKTEDAIKAYKEAISLKPDYAEAYNNLGNSLYYLERFDEAVEFINKSILLKPNYVLAYNNLGIVLAAQGKLDEALDAFQKTLSIKPNYADAYNNLGNVLNDKGRLQDAIDAYKKAISFNPDYADAYNNLGNVLKDKGSLQDAIDAYKKAISLNPVYADAYNNVGNLFKDQGKLQEAIDAFEKALLIKPDYAEAYNNLGIVLRYQIKLHEAIDAFKKAILLKPDYANAHNNLGSVLNDQGKLDEAINAYKKAILLKPDYAEAYSNMAVTIKKQGKLDYAIETFKKSISLNPNNAMTHKNYSFTLLNYGRLKEGFDEYEWRWKTPEFLSKKRHFLQPLWDGNQSLSGKKILLWCEQGIGDTINWSSQLSKISYMAQHCILECQEKLVPLLQRSFPNITVKQENRSLDLERNDFDFHLPMGSLYKHFFYEIKKSSNIKPYLMPNPARVIFWQKRLKSVGNGPFVGISWKSTNKSPERLHDYTSLANWAAVIKIPNITFVNMQYKDFAEDLQKIKDQFGIIIHNFDDINHFDDIDDVAALCSALDMVISTKLTVPFISVGVGTPTKLAIWRQSSSNNILLNPINQSSDKYMRNTWEPWNNVFSSIADDVLKLSENRSGS
jgi:tetratricopeptide (TPR) repeat protein